MRHKLKPVFLDLNKQGKHDQVLEIALHFHTQKVYIKPSHEVEVVKALRNCSSSSKYAEIAVTIVETLKDKNRIIPPDLLRAVAVLIANTSDPLLRFHFLMLVKDIELGDKAYSQMVSKSIILYLSTDEIEHSVMSLSHALSTDLDIEPSTYEVVIHALLEDNDIDISLQLMKGMLYDVFKPIFTRLWGHFIAKAAELEHYVGLAWAMKAGIEKGLVSPSNSVYYTMAELGARHGDSKMAQHAAKHLSNRGFQDDAFLVTLVLEATAKEHDLPTVLRILTSLGEMASQVSVSDLFGVVSEMARSDDNMVIAGEALVTYAKNETRQSQCLTLLLNLCCLGFIRSGKLDLATQFYEELSVQGAQPNQDTLLMLFEKSIASGSGLGLEDAYTSLVPMAVKPSVFVNEELISGFVKVRDFTKARAFYKTFSSSAHKPRERILQLINRAESQS